MFSRIVAIALGGAFGALARWGTSEAVNRIAGQPTPLATATANIIGCFLFGVVWVFAEEKFAMDDVVRAMLLTGFMGAYTTFSTFIFDSGTLLRDGQWLFSFLNIGGQIITGLFFFFMGLALGRNL